MRHTILMICQITGKYELFIKVLIWLTMWLDKCCYAFDVVSWYAQSKPKVQWTELIIWKSQWKSVKVIIFTFHVVLLKIFTGTMCDSPCFRKIFYDFSSFLKWYKWCIESRPFEYEKYTLLFLIRFERKKRN